MTGDRKKTNRRDFLRGKSAREAIRKLVDPPTSPPPVLDAPKPSDSLPADAPPEPESVTEPATREYLLEFARRAMATQFQIMLRAGQYSHGPEAALAALELVEQLEGQLSIYREQSELSQINRQAYREPQPVEAGLFNLLQQSCRLREQTGGAFEICAAPLIRLWGFHHGRGQRPADEEIRQVLPAVDSRLLQLDPEKQTIQFGHPAVELNLGSIGKGYALDRSAALLAQRQIGDYLIHGGKSSILAQGSRRNDDRGWRVDVTHPWRGTPLAQIWLHDQALATSGTSNQFFHHQGQRYGHVIDPRTGYPASGLASVTVLAPTAAEADALATSLFVMGEVEAVNYCRRHDKIAALLLVPGNRGGALELVRCGLNDDQCQEAV